MHDCSRAGVRSLDTLAQAGTEVGGCELLGQDVKMAVELVERERDHGVGARDAGVDQRETWLGARRWCGRAADRGHRPRPSHRGGRPDRSGRERGWGAVCSADRAPARAGHRPAARPARRQRGSRAGRRRAWRARRAAPRRRRRTRAAAARHAPRGGPPVTLTFVRRGVRARPRRSRRARRVQSHHRTATGVRPLRAAGRRAPRHATPRHATPRHAEHLIDREHRAAVRRAPCAVPSVTQRDSA